MSTNWKSTDYKALCAELLKALSEWALGQGSSVDAPLIIRARTALAQPVPEGASNEALANFTAWFCRNYPGPDTIIHRPEWHAPRVFRAAADALARWGRPTTEPVPVAERPWEREGWCNSDNEAFFFDSDTKKWSLCECDKYSPVMTNASDRYTHSLPHHALPVPGAEVALADRGSESSLAEFNDGGMPLG